MKGFLILSLFALVAISVTASPGLEKREPERQLEKREPEAQLEKREPEPSSTEKAKEKDGYGKKSDKKSAKAATSNALREAPTSMIAFVIAGAAAAQLI